MRDADLVDIIRALEQRVSTLDRQVAARRGRVPHLTADPPILEDGMVWIRSDLGKLSFRSAGITIRVP